MSHTKMLTHAPAVSVEGLGNIPDIFLGYATIRSDGLDMVEELGVL